MFLISDYIRSACCNAPISQTYTLEAFIADQHVIVCRKCGQVLGAPTGTDLWCFSQTLLPVDVETPETAWKPVGLLGAKITLDDKDITNIIKRFRLNQRTKKDPQSED